MFEDLPLNVEQRLEKQRDSVILMKRKKTLSISEEIILLFKREDGHY